MTSQDKRWTRITLDKDQQGALIESAKFNKRNTHQQAAWYVIRGLEQDGLISIDRATTHCQCPHCGGQVNLTEDIISDALGSEPQRDVNQ